MWNNLGNFYASVTRHRTTTIIWSVAVGIDAPDSDIVDAERQIQQYSSHDMRRHRQVAVNSGFRGGPAYVTQ